MNAITKRFRVYGYDGHRQRVSFSPSKTFDWSEDGKICIVEMLNSDKTGTNEYTELVITAEKPYFELEDQIFDGLFEDSPVGKVTEIVTEEKIIYVAGNIYS